MTERGVRRRHASGSAPASNSEGVLEQAVHGQPGARRRRRRAWPSSSNVGYSVTSSTPALISCVTSQRSGDVSRLPGRRAATGSSDTRMPDSPRRLLLSRPPGPPGGAAGLAPSAAERAPGSRSAPVAWSTSRMLRLVFWPAVEMTLTQTSCPRLTMSRALATLQPAAAPGHRTAARGRARARAPRTRVGYPHTLSCPTKP